MNTDIEISDDKAKLDLKVIHEFLSNESKWAKGIPFDVVKTSIENSLCFGVYLNRQQIGFCRVVTDKATFGNLVDMFILKEHRGKGYAKQLLDAVMSHSNLQNLRRFTLATSDMHGLYSQFGFKALATPDFFMERYEPNIYKK